MQIPIPAGGSKICHFNVYPVPPQKEGPDGQLTAQTWRVEDTSTGLDVDSFDMTFSAQSTLQQRQSERMVLVFTIAEDPPSDDVSWRFVNDGAMYCEGKADDLDDITFEIGNNGMVLTAIVSCLAVQDEQFSFTFIAMRRNNTSGKCKIFASADPGGRVVRT